MSGSVLDNEESNAMLARVLAQYMLTFDDIGIDMSQIKSWEHSPITPSVGTSIIYLNSGNHWRVSKLFGVVTVVWHRG